jgi:sulfur carrier protein|tara:strand:+ start:90 stop:290 length:201 start_codon:yes stop_codon:yes gene_type:complete
MNVILNGKEIYLNKKLNLNDFLASYNVNKNNIVVEINKNIITRSLWNQYELKDNDEIEIITAVGGG